MAASNSLGVSLLIGQINDVDVADDALTLRGEHAQTTISRSAVSHAFYFEESDEMHGNSKSLVFFDGAGRDVFKFHVFHKSALALEQERIFSFRLKEQARTFSPANVERPANSYNPYSDSRVHDGLAILQPLAVPPGVFFEGILKRLSSYEGSLQFETTTPYVRQSYFGRGVPVRVNGKRIHLHDQTCRMHMQPSAIDRVDALVDDANLVGLVFSHQDQRLFVIRVGSGDEILTESLASEGWRQ
jgi:hypothetical protein